MADYFSGTRISRMASLLCIAFCLAVPFSAAASGPMELAANARDLYMQPRASGDAWHEPGSPQRQRQRRVTPGQSSPGGQADFFEPPVRQQLQQSAPPAEQPRAVSPPVVQEPKVKTPSRTPPGTPLRLRDYPTDTTKRSDIHKPGLSRLA